MEKTNEVVGACTGQLKDGVAGLKEEVAGADGANQALIGSLHLQLHHRTDGISIDLGATQSKGHESARALVGRLIEHEAQTWGGAISKPEVEVAVLVPVGHREATSVIRMIKTTHMGHLQIVRRCSGMSSSAHTHSMRIHCGPVA